jgi:hypothetical protein
LCDAKRYNLVVEVTMTKYKQFGLMILVALSVTACGDGGGDSGGGSGGGAPAARTSVQATTFTFEVSGNGVTFSADIHAYPVAGFAGQQTETDLTTVVLGATTNTYTVTGESEIANFTLNTGAGVLTIVTKKNGAVIRTDTINTNATAIAISN